MQKNEINEKMMIYKNNQKNRTHPNHSECLLQI